MSRKPHILVPTKGSSRPTHIIFVDTETKPEHLTDKKTFNKLYLGVAQRYQRRRNEDLRLQSECVFRTTDEFLKYLNDNTYSKTTTYIVAHNWKFDSLVLDIFRKWVSDDWELKSWYVTGGVALLRFVKGNKKLLLLDNMNFFAGSLANLSKIIDLPKLTIDFDSASDESLTIYCRRDVEVMVEAWKLWLQFLDTNDIGNFRNTLASTAFSAFRYRFMPFPIYIHTESEIIDLERESYRGGRTHPLFVGEIYNSKFYLLDINSMYPYVMSFEDYPISFYGSRENASIGYLTRKIKKYLIIADVTIETDENAYALRKDGRLNFPIGRFRITLTTPELRYALDMGHVKEVHKMAWYRGEKIFREYVKFFYNLRKEYKKQGNKIFDHICKILLNSLYGKFGQWNYNQIEISQVPIDQIEVVYGVDRPTHTHYTLTSLAGKVWQSWKSGESYHSYPAIASHVTAYGRMLLFELIKQSGVNNCYYCDTDSLLVNQEGYDNLLPLINPDRLGALKLETETTFIQVNASKDYKLDDRTKRKGVRHSAKEVTKNTFEQLQFSSIIGMVKEGRVDGVYITEVQKTLTHKIEGFITTESGFLVPESLHD